MTVGQCPCCRVRLAANEDTLFCAICRDRMGLDRQVAADQRTLAEASG